MAQQHQDLDADQIAALRRRVRRGHWVVRETPTVEEDELVWFIFGHRGTQRFIARGDSRLAAWFAAFVLVSDAARASPV